MPRSGPVLVIITLAAACSATGVRRQEPLPAHSSFRLTTQDPLVLEALNYFASHRPALDRCVAREDANEGFCLTCETAAGARAEEVAATWRQRANDGTSDAGWLLSGVVGAGEPPASGGGPGLQAEGERLHVCFERPTPDWSERLRHPALWMEEEPAPRSLELQPIDRLDADLRILSGRALSRALEQFPDRSAKRLESWDSHYGLWLDRSARWTGDPVFRRWLAASVDRETIALLLFDGHARTDSGWVVAESEPLDTPDRLAFAFDSRPRIGIGFDERDPAARSIAARLKARLATLGVDLELSADAELARSSSRPALRLLRHRPKTDDPLLGLIETLRRAGPATERARKQLTWGTAIEGRSRRALHAARLEREWIADAQLIPLVAVESWLLSAPSIGRVESSGYALLELRGAGR